MFFLIFSFNVFQIFSYPLMEIFWFSLWFLCMAFCWSSYLLILSDGWSFCNIYYSNYFSFSSLSWPPCCCHINLEACHILHWRILDLKNKMMIFIFANCLWIIESAILAVRRRDQTWVVLHLTSTTLVRFHTLHTIQRLNKARNQNFYFHLHCIMFSVSNQCKLWQCYDHF